VFRKLLLAAFVVMVFSPVFGQVQVFVTSQTTDGNLGGQAGGDTFCTSAATAANLPGSWTAWLGPGSCPTCLDAVDRIIDGEYQLLNGTVVANSKADLTDGTLAAAINQDETGTTGVTGNVWTGANADGHSTDGPGTCTVWSTNDSATLAQIGLSAGTDATWTDNGGGNTCDQGRRLYCLATLCFRVVLYAAVVM
jgi:hypothetical protein